MKRILFVDDETQVLDGLRGQLRKQRSVWDMTFVASGEEALRALEGGSFDVILSDLRMPGMDGATLLQRVRDQHPHTVRIVLSGLTEQEVSRRMVHIAHQFVAKPIDGNEIKRVVERACGLQAMLEHPTLREAVGKVGALPVKPSLYRHIVEVLERPGSSAADVASLIESDVGTSSQLLKVVNSAFFGLPNRVGDIKAAVSYLGIEMVKALVLSVEMRALGAEAPPVPGFSLEVFQEHALRSARLARKLLPDKVKAQDAFAAAMFQDVGTMVLMARLPDIFASVIEEARATGQSMAEIERDALGVTHAEIGAYLLGIWGLPYGIVEGVAHHHGPAGSGATGLDVPVAVHVASALSEELATIDTATIVGPGVKLDLGFLEQIGLGGQLEAWRALARQ